MEIWKEIEGFNNQYLVSNTGKIKSIGNDFSRKEKELKTYTNGATQHKRVGLRKDGKLTKHAVHRLVAKAFLPNPDNLPFVNHKDNNPCNNNVDNLEWCTREYNVEHYYDNFHMYKNTDTYEEALAKLKRRYNVE
jgi:hypothetical protein